MSYDQGHRFNQVEACLRKSGLELALGKNSLFFKDEDLDDSYQESARKECETLFDEDFSLCKIINLAKRTHEDLTI